MKIYSNRAFSEAASAACLRPVLLRFLLAAQARSDPQPQLASKEVNPRVEALLKKMTLEEKIGQMVQYSAGYATGPGASNLDV